ncbi:MAG: hypothetical protein ACLGPL_00975 [Acidobacteriota bacterium]
MDSKGETILDMFCTAIAMKEKKRALYEEAMGKCDDPVGNETFRMLKGAEEDHLLHMRRFYEDLKNERFEPESCRIIDFKTGEKRALLLRLAKEHEKIERACLDSVAAVEMGLELESGLIAVLNDMVRKAADPGQKKVLERFIAEEREHHRMLADLMFYYTDTEGWFLEKGRQELDGAGAGT